MDRHGRGDGHYICKSLKTCARAHKANERPAFVGGQQDSQEIHDILVNRSAEFDRSAITTNLFVSIPPPGRCRRVH